MYFTGATYVDHERESASDFPIVVDLLKRHHAAMPVLEIGCATGGLLAAMTQIGLDAVGLDISAWAVTKANERLGQERAWLCDVEQEAIPEQIQAKAPFGCLVMWAVYEHFRNPPAVLEKLSVLTAPGTLLIINVSASTLRRDLPKLGWKVLQLDTHLVWDGCVDPLHATVREWHLNDARFRQLLYTRDLGDFVRCVAIKE
jgi:2-polyprenyl-3-methyl-5-hydroxy-6-metoxy-1,4-benzoquinol methylase